MAREKKRGRKDAEYDFTLALAGVAGLTPEQEDALYEAGCSDATLSIRSGRAYAAFSRAAKSLKDAILSAIRDVRSAGIGADVLRVEASGLVTQSEIARKIGRTRQLVHQYATGRRGPGNFPPRLFDLSDGAPLWSWSEVAHWLWENDMVREDVYREAEQIDVINSVLDLEHNRHRTPALTDEVLRSVGTR